MQSPTDATHHQEQRPEQYDSIVVTSLSQIAQSAQSINTRLDLSSGNNNNNNGFICDNYVDRDNKLQRRFYIKTETNLCIIGTLLSFSLCTSILNTFLLSFIIKSIQLSDNGLLGGNLHANFTLLSESLDTNKPTELANDRTVTSELPVRLSDERAFLSNRIHSDSDLEIAPLIAHLKLVARSPTRTASSHMTTKDAQLELSSEQLLIESNQFELDRKVSNGLVESGQRKRPGETENNVDFQYKLANAKRRPRDNQSYQNLLQRGQILLKFDGKQNLFTLNGLHTLNTQNFIKPISALELDKVLSVGDAGITGSLDYDLELHARNGDLDCKSNDMLHLISKTADIRLVSNSRLLARSPKLVLSAKKGLYMKHLVVVNDNNNNRKKEIVPIRQERYYSFEQSSPTSGPVETSLGDESHQIASDLVADVALPANEEFLHIQQGGEQKQEQQQQEQVQLAAKKQHHQYPQSLRAYELIIANGVLMAAAA